MKVTCPSCQSNLSIDDKKIPASGARIKCPTCQNIFPVKPPPVSTPSAAVPLPGAAISAPKPSSQDWEDQPTRAVPLSETVAMTQAMKGNTNPTSVGPVPLPGASQAPAHAPSVHNQVTTVAPAIALPGSASAASSEATSVGPAIALPGAARSEPARQEWEEAPTRAIPLPSIPGANTVVAPPSNARTTSSVAIPLPGFKPASPNPIPSGNSEPTQALQVPPRPSPSEAPRPRPSSSRSSVIALPGAAPPPPSSAPRPETVVDRPGKGSAVPLPGAAATSGAYDAPPEDGDAVPLPGQSAPGTDGSEFEISSASAPAFDLGQPPPSTSSGAFEFDVAEPPPTGGATTTGYEYAPPEEPTASPGGFDLDLPPAPEPTTIGPSSFEVDSPEEAPSAFNAMPEPSPGAFDFAQPPAAAPGAFDFGLPPSAPPAPQGLAFDEAAPPPPAAMGFGEVDLGGASPPDLEFDPSTGGAPRDDLEADLSAPLPSARPQGPADGLEMLSFIDDTARQSGVKPEEPGSVRRFHVKRRSGKVFGPFEEAVIAKMLEEGQLLGNEEVSLDTETWQPVGSEPAFQAVIAKMMEAPARASTQMNMPPVDQKPKGPSMERLKQLYEGRMAAVAVVESKEPVPFKKRLPFIIAGVAVAAVLAVGVGVGLTTPYGYFGLKLLLPSKVREGTREYEYLQAARKGFSTDTYKSLVAAKDSAAAALKIKEFPEARAVWSQAVFYLDRKYHAASAADVQKAQGELGNVKLLGDKHPEVLRTLASEALTRKAPDAALGFIADALARDSGNLDSMFLRAEAYLQKKQPAQAKTEFEQILKKDPKSARAHHALASVLRSQNELAKAVEHYEAALASDPGHLSSAIELAEIAIVGKKDLATGTPLVDKALTEEAKSTLSTAERGKALALKAEVQVVSGKLTEAVPLFEEALVADKTNPFTQSRLGRVQLALHNPDRAVALFKEATTTSPDNLEYTEGYLTALVTVGRMSEASQVVQQATARFPGNAALSYLSGRVADALDKAKEAEDAYKGAIAAPDADNPDAYLYLARLYMRFRRFADARPQLEAGLEKAPSNAALRVGMGELAFYERDLERAEVEFKKAMELDPASADAALGQSRVELENGRAEEARAFAEKALSLNPHLSGGKLQYGITLWKVGALEDSLKVLNEAHTEEPRNSQITVTLGAVAFDKGDLTKALDYLNAADPANPDGNYWRGRVQNAQKNHTQAIEAMKRAIDFNSKNPLYHYWMGRILNDARKTDDAISEWKIALELDPDYADALESMGRVYFERNDFKRAIKNYEEALKVVPTQVALRVAIGDAQMKLDHWDDAIATYTKALDQDDTNAGAWFQMGLAFEEKKQVKKAIDAYLHATRSDGVNPEAWRQLGWLYKQSKKNKDAKVSFSKYLELRPNAEDKKQIEDELTFIDQQ